jgi:hypothetical protein
MLLAAWDLTIGLRISREDWINFKNLQKPLNIVNDLILLKIKREFGSEAYYSLRRT